MQFQHPAFPGIEQYLSGYKCVNTFHWCLMLESTYGQSGEKLVNRAYTENVNNFDRVYHVKCN